VCVCVYGIRRIHIHTHTHIHTHPHNIHILSLKLYVSFAKETHKRDDILQKRPIISTHRLTSTHIHTHPLTSTPHPHIRIVWMCVDVRMCVEIIGLFCRISSLLWVSFAKETYNFRESMWYTSYHTEISQLSHKSPTTSTSIKHQRRTCPLATYSP